MIPNGQEIIIDGHNLTFESEPSDYRGCFFENRDSCPDCDEGIWVEEGYPWHTEPPTEEGDYVVLCSTDGEYMVCHLEANLKPEIFHKYFKAWWGQKIEPYKEKS